MCKINIASETIQAFYVVIQLYVKFLFLMIYWGESLQFQYWEWSANIQVILQFLMDRIFLSCRNDFWSDAFNVECSSRCYRKLMSKGNKTRNIVSSEWYNIVYLTLSLLCVLLNMDLTRMFLGLKPTVYNWQHKLNKKAHFILKTSQFKSTQVVAAL